MIEDRTSLTIDVTADDIAHGVREDCNACPFARALRRHKGFENAYVNDRYIETDHGARHDNLYRLPDEAVEWIASFDAGKQMAPIKVELDLTDED